MSERQPIQGDPVLEKVAAGLEGGLADAERQGDDAQAEQLRGLLRLVGAWSTLPEDVRATLTALAARGEAAA